MSTVNPVRFYFLFRPETTDLVRRYIAIAYQTATDQNIHPKAVLVRSIIHKTTTVSGIVQEDPKGKHLTLCYKDQAMHAQGTHIASHGYVDLDTDSHIREATHTSEKPDATKKRKSGRPVWPAKKFPLEMEVAFGHLPDEAEIKTHMDESEE